jgi:hypothetical protein
MRAVTMALTGMIATIAAASAQTGTPGTVNAVSDNEIARAKAAISHAGYQPVVLEMAQDHNLFFTAIKGGETYEITVTPDRKLYVSTPLAADRRS